MSDAGTKKTDKEIKKVEQRLQEVYTEAEKDMQDKLTTFLSKYSAKNQKKLDQLGKGEITQEEYSNWVQGQVFQSQQWTAKHAQIARAMTNTNKIAVAMVNGSMNGVFAFNSNYQAYQIEEGFGINFGFGLYDTSTVTNLVKNDPQILPKWKIDEKKDYIWNEKKLNNAITQGIIQGERLDQISKRISTGLCSQNENLMKTFARTGMTQAQNAGRYQRQMEAKKLGINMVKEWMSTLDGRTRDSHRHMDGEKIKVGDKWHPQKFSNGCRYPGDPEGPPQEVYNCRCTLVADLVDYPAEYERYDNIDGVPIKGMTYDEWAKAKGGVGYTKTKYKKISGKPTVTKAEAIKIKAAEKELQEAENELDKLQAMVDNYNMDKKFSGIWYGQDVGYADWDAKKDSIQGKRDYYIDQVTRAQRDFYDMFDPDSDEADDLWDAFSEYYESGQSVKTRAKLRKIARDYGYDDDDLSDIEKVFDKSHNKIQIATKHLNELNEFEQHGEEYSKILKAREEAKKKVNEAKQKIEDLKPKPKTRAGNIFGPDAYSEERKKNALRASTSREADNVLRPKTREVWKKATRDQRRAAYDYTAGSGGFNRPLRGYDGGWSKSYFKGVGNVSLNNEGKEKEIKDLVEIIKESKLQQDTWLVRGVSGDGMAGFLNVDLGVLQNTSEQDLQALLLGKEITDTAFMSCGSAAGTGFGANLSIYCPKGTQGIYVEPFSAYGGDAYGKGGYNWDGEADQDDFGQELETLLQRNTRFKVTKVEKDIWGDIKIEVEVVGQDPDDFSPWS